MTRLKLLKVGDELHIEGRILCGTILVGGILHKPSLKFILFKDTHKGQVVILEGRANTLVGLKKKMKAALIELGGNFNDELRGRKLVLE